MSHAVLMLPAAVVAPHAREACAPVRGSILARFCRDTCPSLMPQSSRPRQSGLLKAHRPEKPRTRRGKRPACAASAGNGAQSTGTAQQPQRGVVILPGLGNNAADYAAIAADLEGRGLAVEVAQVSRPDWLRNAAGLTDLSYWRGTLQPRPTVNWYMDRIVAALQAVEDQSAVGAPVTLLAHSAGGWLSRVFLLEEGTGRVDRLVTLGSPHNPPPPGVVDQTRGILSHVAATSPGNFHEQIAYVTVAGKFLKGAGLREKGATLGQKVVGAGYAQVCGRPDVWGDGITPVECAHLEGAKQLTLSGVFHSPVGAAAGRSWYGSGDVIDRWAPEIWRDADELAGFKKELGDVADDTMLPDAESVSSA